MQSPGAVRSWGKEWLTRARRTRRTPEDASISAGTKQLTGSRIIQSSIQKRWDKVSTRSQCWTVDIWTLIEGGGNWWERKGSELWDLVYRCCSMACLRELGKVRRGARIPQTEIICIPTVDKMPRGPTIPQSRMRIISESSWTCYGIPCSPHAIYTPIW